jgi:hypothetical protein
MIPEGKFKSMLDGNKDNPDNTPYARGGSLAKQTIRGTVWRFHIEGRASPGFSNAPVAPDGGNDEQGKAFAQDWASTTQGMKGIGIKASVGSRNVRGEVIIKFGDSDAANGVYEKWTEKNWVKDQENEVPRWFKGMAGKTSIPKTAVNVVRDGLSFRSSGDLFIIRCEVQTKLIQQGVGSLVNSFTAQGAGGGGGGQPGMP